MADLTDFVARVKADVEARGLSLDGACGAFNITMRVAWLLRQEGAGLLDKPGGNNCHGYSVDYVIFTDGRGVDILGDAGGLNKPMWDEHPPDPQLSGRWRAPIDPGDTPPVPHVPDPPGVETLVALVADRVLEVEQKIETLSVVIDSHAAFVSKEQNRHADRIIQKLSEAGHALTPVVGAIHAKLDTILAILEDLEPLPPQDGPSH